MRGRYYDRWMEERDRRYTEVAEARAEALKIKEQADRDALELAQRNQTYKDERSDKMSEDVIGSRGNYATKEDLSQLGNQFATALKPIQDFIAGASATQVNGNRWIGWAIAAVMALIAFGGLCVTAAGVVIALSLGG
jgi:hypothetical protein